MNSFAHTVVMAVVCLGWTAGCQQSVIPAPPLNPFVVDPQAATKIELTINGIRATHSPLEIPHGKTAQIMAKVTRPPGIPWDNMWLFLVSRDRPEAKPVEVFLGFGHDEQVKGKHLYWECTWNKGTVGRPYPVRAPVGEYDAYLCWTVNPRTIAEKVARNKDGRIDRTTIFQTSVTVVESK
jgi:hypothetical protein